MSISVALCTYNGERFVAQQVQSILNQTRPVDEIIVSDDASSDDTVLVIEQTVANWRTSGSRPPLALRVTVNDATLGVVANFEQALGACSGDYLVLSDQDDVWHEDKVERLSAVLDYEPDVVLVGSNARMVTSDGAAVHRDLWQTIGLSQAEFAGLRDDAFAVLMRRNLITGATVMLRRTVLDTARPFPPSWVHDEWLAVVAAAGDGLAVIDETLTDYRQHGGNQIGATNLTGSGRVARLRTPRTARNERLLARSAALEARVIGIGGSADRLRLSQDKLAHEQARSTLPVARWRRIAPVLREWNTGRYRSCGLGAQDVLRDLVQPL